MSTKLQEWLASEQVRLATNSETRLQPEPTEVWLIDAHNRGASIEMRTPEICLAAVQRDGHAIVYLTEVQRSPEVCLAAVQQDGYAILHLTDAQRSPEVCLAAVQQFGNAIEHLTDAQRSPEVCLAAVQQNGNAILHLTEAQGRPEVCLAAVQQNGYAIEHLTEAQCAQPLISDWIDEHWEQVAKLLGRDKAREVAQAILDARQADAEGAQAGHERARA